MSVVQMTDEEKALLDLAYTDGERILEGKLFDYQEKALQELRQCVSHLKKRYPNEAFQIISFQPSSAKGCVEIQFIQPGYETREFMLKYENGTYTDNFYDVPHEKEYDSIVEGLLKDAGIHARVYTQFPFLISEEIGSGRELMDRRPPLGRHSEIFMHADALPTYEEATAFSEKVKEVFVENGIYSSGIIFFIRDLNSLGLTCGPELDAYARNRKNLKNMISAGFRCFQVKE